MNRGAFLRIQKHTAFIFGGKIDYTDVQQILQNGNTSIRDELLQPGFDNN
jgi:hypothetical protein